MLRPHGERTRGLNHEDLTGFQLVTEGHGEGPQLAGWPMSFKDASYDPDTIALMGAALNTAWAEAQERQLATATADAARTTMASAILTAIGNGV